MSEVRVVAVLGAGTMGRGIAQVSATAGLDVRLLDAEPATLQQAVDQIGQTLAEGVTRGKLGAADAERALDRIRPCSSLQDAVAGAELVIEAVPERLDLKVQVLRAARTAAPSAVLASNTSGLSISELQGRVDRPDLLLGLHFFNPVHKMKLLEVVRALETDADTLAAAVEVGRRMGKEVVVIKESPGFITSRINAMIGNEAFYMLQEGIASAEDIDKALKLGLNHPMGPFELVDLVGLDTRLSILQYLHRTLGEKFRPADLLVEYVKAGRLGKKSGRGVYDYSEGKPKLLQKTS